MKRRSTVPLAALLAALGLGLAACGSEEPTRVAADAENAAIDVDRPAAGDDDPDSTDTDTDTHTPAGSDAGGGPEPAVTADTPQGSLRSVLLAETVDRSTAMSSARFEARIDLVGGPQSELPGPVSMTFTGAYDEPNEASEITIDFGDLFALATEAGQDDASAPGADELVDAFAATFAQPMQVITIGDRAWIKSGLLAMFGVGSDMWLEGDGESGAEMSAGMGPGGTTSPTELLEMLADADATIEVVGSEDVRGTTTTHYRADVDVEGLAGRLDRAGREALESELGAPAGAGYTAELWLDDDRLHRMLIRIDEIPPGAGSDGLESMLIVFDLWDHGLDLGITPPPAEQILTEDQLGFGLDDLGGFGSAG